LKQLCSAIGFAAAGSIWTSRLMWFASRKGLIWEIHFHQIGVSVTRPHSWVTQSRTKNANAVFQWQIDRKEFRLCSIGVNSYLIFLLADNTGGKFFTLMRHRGELDGPNACGRNCNNYSLNRNPFSNKQYRQFKILLM
jgi:hypothetical protein